MRKRTHHTANPGVSGSNVRALTFVSARSLQPPENRPKSTQNTDPTAQSDRHRVRATRPAPHRSRAARCPGAAAQRQAPDLVIVSAPRPPPTTDHWGLAVEILFPADDQCAADVCPPEMKFVPPVPRPDSALVPTSCARRSCPCPCPCPKTASHRAVRARVLRGSLVGATGRLIRAARDVKEATSPVRRIPVRNGRRFPNPSPPFRVDKTDGGDL